MAAAHQRHGAKPTLGHCLSDVESDTAVALGMAYQ